MRLILVLLLSLFLCLPAKATGFTFTYTFQAYAPLLAAQLNTNFGQVATALTSGGNGYLPIGNSSDTYTSALPTSTGSSIKITGGSGTLNFEVKSAGEGYLPIGNSGGTTTNALPTSSGSTILITGGNGTLDLEVASGGAGYLPIGNGSGGSTSALPTSSGGTVTITPSDGGLDFEVSSSVIQHKEINLTAADIGGMYETPVQLISAPSEGTLIIYAIVFTDIPGTDGWNNGGVVHYVISTSSYNSSDATSVAEMAATVLTDTAVETRFSLGSADSNFSYSVPTSWQPTAFFITNDSGPFELGNGTAKVDIWYSVISDD